MGCVVVWKKKKYIQQNVLIIFLFSKPSLAPSFLSQPSFFVVYNMVSTEVLAVFENTSDQLLELFENFCDLFRNATLHSQAVQFPCSASSNNYARQVQRRYRRDEMPFHLTEIPDMFTGESCWQAVVQESLFNERKNCSGCWAAKCQGGFDDCGKEGNQINSNRLEERKEF